MIFTNAEFWALTLVLSGALIAVILALISNLIDASNKKKRQNGDKTFDELNAAHEAALAENDNLNPKEIDSEVYYRKLGPDEAIELGDTVRILEKWRDVDEFYVGKKPKDFPVEFNRPLKD